MALPLMSVSFLQSKDAIASSPFPIATETAEVAAHMDSAPRDESRWFVAW